MVFRIEHSDPDYAASRRRGFRIPTSGVRAEVDDTDWWTDLQAIALVLPKTAVFSHTTAAFITGLPLPESDPKPFHVTVPQGRGKRRGIVWHKRPTMDEPDLQKSFRITSPLRTWLDLGSVVHVDHLVAAADVLLRRKLATSEELRAIPPVRGASLLRAAAALASPRSWSPRESLLRVGMFRHGLPQPELNREIIEDGIVLGTGDLVFEEFRCIVDYDGDTHKDLQRRTQDTQTRNAYAQAGWCHLAVTSRMFDHLTRTLREIEAMLRSRGWAGPCTPRHLPAQVQAQRRKKLRATLPRAAPEDWAAAPP